MDSSWDMPFSKSEMDAARGAFRNEEDLLARVVEKLRRLARQLPFSEDVLAAYFCVRDPATPARVRWILLMALAYFVMPLDTIPDVLPVLGFTDDAAVLAAAFTAVRGSVQPEHREKAKTALDAGSA